jgi:hypothetical protein
MKNFIPGRRRKFGYGLKDVVGPLKTTSWAQRDESSLEVFYKLASKVSPKWPSWAQRDEATLEIPRKLIFQCQQGGFASELTLGPYQISPVARECFFLVPKPPATKKCAHPVHCAVISWLLKKVPVGRGARVAFSWAPWLPLLQVPKLWLLDVHVCGSFAFSLNF